MLVPGTREFILWAEKQVSAFRRGQRCVPPRWRASSGSRSEPQACGRGPHRLCRPPGLGVTGCTAPGPGPSRPRAGPLQREQVSAPEQPPPRQEGGRGADLGGEGEGGLDGAGLREGDAHGGCSSLLPAADRKSGGAEALADFITIVPMYSLLPSTSTEEDEDANEPLAAKRITMVAGTLYTYPENWRAFKALIAAQYSRAQVRVLSAPPHFHFGQTNRTPEFLRKFPAGKGIFCIICSLYISVMGSLGDIVPPASTWVFPTLGIMHHNKQATENAKEEVRRILGLLDTHLKTRTFLVGERVTDITVVCILLWLYKQVLEPSFRQAFPNTNRWFLTCINQPQFRAVLGEVKLCEKMAQFDAKRFAESQPKKDTPRKEKGSREEKQKPQVERKEEKKAAAPAPEEEMDECEQALAAEPKAKDPFAHLPKSTFVLDEFKRKYSNEDTLTVALPYFWEHFDKDGWSLWYAEYHFPEELTQTFMSCNLITGMFQRLDKLRKNAFASVILFGTNNSSSISRVWVFRGQELAFLLSPDWQVDYESYTWWKLDPGSEET
nr:elongation factor 1-gamma-like [Vulpes vulpes]